VILAEWLPPHRCDVLGRAPSEGLEEVKMEKVERGVKLSTLAAVQETTRSHEIEI